jgi:geranylgeranyl reductase family protein
MAAVDVELVVVGAGPAGTAAALAAREAGLRVEVFDRARFPRDKTCGDGLTAAALRELDALGLDARTLPGYVAVGEAVLASPSGRDVRLPLDATEAGVVTRRVLDAALVEHARSQGIAVHDGVGVVGTAARDTHVELTLDDGPLAFVVAADGHFSTVRRALAPVSGNRAHPDLGTWHAFRRYYRGVRERRLHVVFDDDLLPGYAWVFPVGDDGANVGFGVLRDADGGPTGKQLAAWWRTIPVRSAVRRALGPDAEPDGPTRAWPIPAGYDPARLTHGRVLFAGDAAAVVDALTGEGIAQAVATGRLAARAVAAGGGPVAVASRYRVGVGRELGTDLRFARALQRVLTSPAGARASIAAAALTPWTRREFARWMFEDYPRALLGTPGRWKRPFRDLRWFSATGT